MKALRFPEAVGVALLLALGAGVIHYALTFVLHPYDSLAAVVLLIGMFYATYLLLRSPRKDGRVVIASLGLLGSGLTIVFAPSLLVLVAQQVLVFWVIRIVCYHQRIGYALGDLLICALSVAAMLWAFAASASVVLAVWSTLLCQSLFTFTTNASTVAADAVSPSQLAHRFDRAHRGAQQALHRATSDAG